MTKFSFNDTYEKAEKEFNLGKGEYFKPQEGENKVRLVSECLPHPGVYQGKPNFKWLCQVIDLKGIGTDSYKAKVVPYFMPTTIYKLIQALQASTDYAFEEVPMPYDINVNAKNAGVKEVEYSVLPAKANRELSVEEQRAIHEAPTVQELQQKVNEAKDGEGKGEVKPVVLPEFEGQKEEEINAEEIPF